MIKKILFVISLIIAIYVSWLIVNRPNYPRYQFISKTHYQDGMFVVFDRKTGTVYAYYNYKDGSLMMKYPLQKKVTVFNLASYKFEKIK